MKNLAVLNRNQPLKLTEVEAEAKVLKVQISYDIAVPEADPKLRKVTLQSRKVEAAKKPGK